MQLNQNYRKIHSNTIRFRYLNYSCCLHPKSELNGKGIPCTFQSFHNTRLQVFGILIVVFLMAEPDIEIPSAGIKFRRDLVARCTYTLCL